MSTRTSRLASAVAAAVVSAGVVTALGTTPAHAAYSVTGVDVASYQHPNGAAINWASVKAAGEDFAIVKASEGMSGNFDNPYFGSDFDRAKANGLIVGSYHFGNLGTPVVDDAKGEAAHYAAEIAGRRNGPGVLPPILDIEDANGLSVSQVQTWALTFLQEVQRITGRKPIIYTFSSFGKTYLNTSTFGTYPLWIAHYGVSAPSLPSAWSTWKMWQYTSQARVSGITGDVDRNYFNGTLSQLQALAGGTTTPTNPIARNGICETGEFCLYYNSNHLGSVSDFNTSIADYGATQPDCYEFKGAGAGQGECVKNNAASAWNRTGSTVRVYFNSGYGGTYDTFAAGAKKNLVNTYNDNASHKIG